MDAKYTFVNSDEKESDGEKSSSSKKSSSSENASSKEWDSDEEAWGGINQDELPAEGRALKAQRQCRSSLFAFKCSQLGLA